MPLRRIGFAGTRRLETLRAEWLDLYTTAARRCGQAGHMLVTGAATGCDQRAAAAALRAGGPVELWLPWPRYEQEWVTGVRESYPGQVGVAVFERPRDDAWWELIDRLHPGAQAGRRLSDAVRRLMARNGGIAQNDLLIALPDPGRPGGTGFCLQLAAHCGVKTLDLSLPAGRQALQERLALPPGLPVR